MTSILHRIAEGVQRFVFNAKNAYYEYASDLKPLSGGALVDVIEQREADSIRLMGKLSDALSNGDISLGTWRDGVAVELRRAHSQSFALGRGGWQQVTLEDRQIISDRLKAEFKHLRQFSQKIADGNLTDAQIRARLNLYSQHIMASYWRGEREAKTDAGFTKEMRVLNAKESCPDCVEIAALGWVDIGTLPEIGDSQCLSNCLCTFNFSKD